MSAELYEQMTEAEELDAAIRQNLEVLRLSGLAELGSLWNSIQSWLFPVLEDQLGELDGQHREFVAVCELCDPQSHMDAYRWVGNGCPPNSRLAMCKAFIAKAVWDFPTTRDLIDAVRHRPTLRRLAGWEYFFRDDYI